MSIEQMIGKTFVEVAGEVGGDSLKFKANDGAVFEFHHYQDCCESVAIESIVGDLSDLIGEPLLVAEESTGETPADHKFEYEPESCTWTFYKFATRKGYVDVRWLGESNGYYSESVDLRVTAPA